MWEEGAVSTWVLHSIPLGNLSYFQALLSKHKFPKIIKMASSD